MRYAGLIVGLGNPGARYARTRHNFGFMLADSFIRYAQTQSGWSCASRNFRGPAQLWEVADQTNQRNWLVVKPLTFMNLSGQIVGELGRKHGFMAENVIVLHDELDLPLGTARFKFSGGLAGHNGLKSVATHLGTRDFVRLRLGIGRPADNLDIAGYVLCSFLPEEWSRVHSAMDLALDALINFTHLGLDEAIAKLHSK